MAREAHFGPELFTFLRQLTRNNNREWFEKNKSRYIETVRTPMLQFIADFGGKLRPISANFVADPRPSGGSMFRIYRDVRFAHDKSPYKTVASAQFRHERGKTVHVPGFYLHLEPGNVFAAGGIWHPDSATLLRVRQAIAERPKEWKRAISGKPFRETARLSGESLSRPPKGFDPDHPLIEDLRRKDFVAIVELDEATACSPDFLGRYAKVCRTMAPMMRFVTDAVGLQF